MAVNKAVKRRNHLPGGDFNSNDFLLNYILCHNFYYKLKTQKQLN